MKKLTLALDDLRVESYATGEPAADPGTVRAHADHSIPYTEWATCANTCDCPSWSGAECKTGCIG